MSRFETEQTVYYIERVDKRTNEERILTYDSYDRNWRPVFEFNEAKESKDRPFLEATRKGFEQMEQIKVQFGMVSEPEFEYHVIEKNENSYRVDENGDRIIEDEEATEQ